MKILMKRPIYSLVAGSTVLVVFAGIVVPLALGMQFRLEVLPIVLGSWPLPPEKSFTFGLLAILPFVAALYLARSSSAESKRLVVYILATALICRWLLVYLLDNQLVSDFKTMWEFATAVTRGDRPLLAASIQEVRTLTYLLPVAHLAGGERIGYEIANILVTTATTGFIYVNTRILAGPRAALAALIVAAFAPEPWFANEIPTHDIPGSFYLVGGIIAFTATLLLYSKENKPFYYAAISSLIGAVMLALADLQRGTGIFFLLALLVTFVLFLLSSTRISNARIAFGLVLFILLPIVVNPLMKSIVWGDRVDQDSYQRVSQGATWSWIATYAGPDSLGEFREYANNRPFLAQLRSARLTSFAKAKVVSEYSANPVGIIQHYTAKSARLYNLGGQAGTWYYGNLKNTEFIPTETGNRAVRQVLNAYTAVYFLIFAFLSFIALLMLVLQWRNSPMLALPLLTLSILSLALIAVGEIQSRYVFPAWYILSIYIGILLTTKMRAYPRFHEVAPVARSAVLPALLMFIILTCSLGWAVYIFDYRHGRLYSSNTFVRAAEIETTGLWGVTARLPESEPLLLLDTDVSLGEHAKYELVLFVSAPMIDTDNCGVALKLDIGSKNFEQKVSIAKNNMPTFVTFAGIEGRDGPIKMRVQVEEDSGAELENKPVCGAVQIDYLHFQKNRSALD